MFDLLFVTFLLISRTTFSFLFCLPKKKEKKAPEKDYIPFSGLFPDWAVVLL